MLYRKIGTIDNIFQIPFDKNLIITGRIGNGWSYQIGKDIISSFNINKL